MNASVSSVSCDDLVPASSLQAVFLSPRCSPRCSPRVFDKFAGIQNLSAIEYSLGSLNPTDMTILINTVNKVQKCFSQYVQDAVQAPSKCVMIDEKDIYPGIFFNNIGYVPVCDFPKEASSSKTTKLAVFISELVCGLCVVHSLKDSKKGVEAIKNEIDILRFLSLFEGHERHCVRFYACHEEMGILMQEYLPGTALVDAISDRALSPHDKWRVTTDVCRALAFLQEHKVVHGDMKPDNVMLVRSWQGVAAKLIDFGLGFIYAGLSTSRACPAVYCTPEQERHEMIDPEKLDPFAFGLTILLMCESDPFSLLDDLKSDRKYSVLKLYRDTCSAQKTAFEQLLWMLLDPVAATRGSANSALPVALKLQVEGFVKPISRSTDPISGLVVDMQKLQLQDNATGFPVP